MNIASISGPSVLLSEVRRLGFLPFFANEVPGFSIEEHTPARLWFSETEDGPWEWKGPVARSGVCVYGKFFKGRAGFISLDWFPVFANYRRDGYDFDALYDDGFASHKDKQVYDVLAEHGSLLSKELKALCNYRKDGNKGFDAVITRLQMETYVSIADFEYAVDKAGRQYGWGIARYSTPEAQFGADLMAEAYREDPAVSRARVYAHLQSLCPEATEKQIRSLLGDK
ncbi:MAG: hypothetical protein IJ259_00745 [Oscillospiraceae bacterium]|nr:hypothetical protein [Oscillospiraceae bacterium]